MMLPEATLSAAALLTAGRTLFGLIFVSSGLLKARDPRTTGRMVYALDRRFHRFYKSLTTGTIVTEASIGVALLAGLVPRLALAASTGLMLVFDVVLVRLRQRGFYESCGCFGRFDASRMGSLHYLRNGLLTALSLGLSYSQLRLRIPPNPDWNGVTIGAGAFLFVSAAYLGAVAASKTLRDPELFRRTAEGERRQASPHR